MESRPPASAPPAPPVDLDEKVRHLPEEARAAFRRYQAGAAAADIDQVIFAILEDFLPRKSGAPLCIGALPGDTRLMDGLGLDSLAITEIVFFTEDLFGISIANEEIIRVRTIDDLRQFIQRKVGAHRAG
jgi:acyl carrier protein